MSGEALQGKDGDAKIINEEVLQAFSEEISLVRDRGVEIAIVIGAGNIHRGVPANERGMDRTTSDHMGMLATVINSLALQASLERFGVFTRVMSAIDMKAIAEPYIRRRAIRHLEKDRVIIFAAGTGNPYFTTDTAAALRGSEIDVDVLLKATSVDGVYDRDPAVYSDVKKFDQVHYLDMLSKGIRVMDSTAVTLCMENKLDIIVFDIFEKGSILKIVEGKKVGTFITK